MSRPEAYVIRLAVSMVFGGVYAFLGGEADLTRWIRPTDAVTPRTNCRCCRRPPRPCATWPGTPPRTSLSAAAGGLDAARPVRPRVCTGPDGTAWLTVG